MLWCTLPHHSEHMGPQHSSKTKHDYFWYVYHVGDLPLHSINTGDNQQQPFHQLLASEAAASQHLNLPDVATAATQAHPQEGIHAAGGQQNSAAAAKAAFLRQYRHHYGYNGWLDKHWQQEVGYRFGQHLQHYLDFTGAALYTRVSGSNWQGLGGDK